MSVRPFGSCKQLRFLRLHVEETYMRIPLLIIAIYCAFCIGCTPTCETTCNKLVSCGAIEDGASSALECENSCMAQQELYNIDWDDEAKQEGFDELKSCIVRETCEDIAGGVCYDDELYVW